MSNYTQVTFFAPKDLLLSGDPNKIIRGAQVDPELSAISIAIASKYDALNSFAGPIQFADGAVGAPAIAFHSETNTGIYKSALHILSITSNGTLEGSFGGGQVLGAPTGGAKGVGTLNATGVFVNGASLGTGSANPTATIGLAAINGTATTFMTSDSAPPLSQAIIPTWTGLHTFNGRVVVGAAGGGASLTVSASGANTGINTQAASGTNAIQCGAAGNNIGFGTNVGLSGSAENIYVQSAAPLALGTTQAQSLNLYTNGALRISTNSSGAVTIFAPTAGIATTISGFSGSAVLKLSPAGTSDSSAIFNGAAAGRAVLEFDVNAVLKGYAGINNGAGDLITGSAAGAYVIRSQGTEFDVSVNSGTSIQFQVLGITAPTLKGYGPIAAGLVDLTPDASTFTITYTGMTAAVTGTAVWTRVGNLVLLFLPVATGTSNATTMQATGIPNAINPTRAQWLFQPALGVAEDNGTSASGACRVNTNNTIDFSVNGNVAGLSSWTASGTKGIQNGYTIMYLLN